MKMSVQHGRFSCKHLLLTVVDTLLCLFVFFPLAILHWRGTWGLQDVYFLPHDIVASSWMSLVVGTVTSLLIQLLQPLLHSSVRPADGAWYLVASRLHMYVCGWTTMCYWRGLWNLLDIYLTEDWKNSVALMLVAQVITFLTKTSRNNIGLPISQPMLDTDEQLLAPDTVFKVDPNKRLRFIGDVCFTQLVIVTANIIIWRGIWNVFDAFLFPSRHLLSDLSSLVGGYAMMLAIFCLQWPLSRISLHLSAHRSQWPKIIYEDCVMLVLTWVNLLLWRGGWDLCLRYVVPDPLVGNWMSHWLGTWGLIVLQMFNNVAMNGIEIDGEHPGGEGIFPTRYLRELLIDSKEAWGGGGGVTVVEMVGMESEADEEEEDSDTAALLNGRV